MKSDGEVRGIRAAAEERERDARTHAETNDAAAIADAIAALRYELEIASDALRSIAKQAQIREP